MFPSAIVKKILAALERGYPRGHRPWAGKDNPYQTLISTILSAQTTDSQVDRVTPELFRRYPTPEKLSHANQKDVAKIVKSVGLYQTKAKHIIATSRCLVTKFGSTVPASRESLMQLPGVGRKTANVVLIKAFGQSTMPVDTHVFRIANRIGLAHAQTPEKTEEQLEEVLPQHLLGKAHHWLIHHGRTLCKARHPLCSNCPVLPYCRFGRTNKQKQNGAQTTFSAARR